MVFGLPLPFPPTYFHGGLPGRCREGAILAQQAAAWRVAKAGRIALLVLFDATNAFCCSDKAALDAVTGGMNALSAPLLRDYHKWGHFHLRAAGAEQPLLRPGRGGMMGHVWAPYEFNRDYEGGVHESLNQTRSSDMHLHSALVGRDVVGSSILDISQTVFVGDIAVQAIFDSVRELLEAVKTITATLVSNLNSRGYFLNKSKTEVVLGMRSEGSFRMTRKAQRGHFAQLGEAKRVARYLGYRLSADGGSSDEVAHRIQCSNVVRKRLAPFWRLKGVGFSVKRIVFIAHVAGTLLSGAEALVVTALHIGTMESSLVRKLRYLDAVRGRCDPPRRRRTNRQVRRAWRMAELGIELRVRRLRLYQAWCRSVADHIGVLTAIFGTATGTATSPAKQRMDS